MNTLKIYVDQSSLLFRYFDFYPDSSWHRWHRFVSTQSESSDRRRGRSQEEEEMTFAQLKRKLRGRRLTSEIFSQCNPKLSFSCADVTLILFGRRSIWRHQVANVSGSTPPTSRGYNTDSMSPSVSESTFVMRLAQCFPNRLLGAGLI